MDVLHVPGVRCHCTAGLHHNIQRPQTWPQISIHCILTDRQSGADPSAQNCTTQYGFWQSRPILCTKILTVVYDCYSAPVGVRSIVINPSVCASVCLSVREHISGTAGPIHTKFYMQIPCGRGSILRRWHCATLCTSSFMDDVMFGRNGRDSSEWCEDTGAESDIYECLFSCHLNLFMMLSLWLPG